MELKKPLGIFLSETTATEAVDYFDMIVGVSNSQGGYIDLDCYRVVCFTVRYLFRFRLLFPSFFFTLRYFCASKINTL